jgi:sirohydrochlorin cobaltochelatase
MERRAAELDAQIRDWPRRADNDPYKRGLEQLAAALRPLLPTELFAVGYNEFCRPSIPEAVEGLIARGAMRILAIPTMLTPGGVHSEVDIPRALEALRRSHPGVRIEYAWPFDLREVATLLAAHLGRAAGDSAPKSAMVK